MEGYFVYDVLIPASLKWPVTKDHIMMKEIALMVHLQSEQT